MLIDLTLAVCALLVGLLIWRYDLHEREPWYMMLLAAALGFGLMMLVGPAESFTLERLGFRGGSNAVIAMVAATHEGLARLAVPVAILILLPAQFNDPLDGIIYGSVAGLGMAVEESLYYLGLPDAHEALVPGAELVRLFAHPILGGIGAFALGMIPARKAGWAGGVAAGLAVALSLHVLWDYAALRSGARTGVWDGMPAAALMLVGMMAYGALVSLGARWSGRVFDPEGTRSLWGWPFSRRRGAAGASSNGQSVDDT